VIFVKFRRDIGVAPWQMNCMMKNLKNCLVFLSGIVLFAGCGQDNPPAPPTQQATPPTAATPTTPPPAATPAAPEKEVAVINTTEGDMVVEFWTDAAPKTIENFKKLAKSGFYDGTAFHRVILSPKTRPKRPSGAPAIRVTKLTPNSTTIPTSAALFPWPVPTIPIRLVASSLFATAVRANWTINTRRLAN
jgi:hypothetical protein